MGKHGTGGKTEGKSLSADEAAKVVAFEHEACGFGSFHRRSTFPRAILLLAGALFRKMMCLDVPLLKEVNIKVNLFNMVNKQDQRGNHRWEENWKGANCGRRLFQGTKRSGFQWWMSVGVLPRNGQNAL